MNTQSKMTSAGNFINILPENLANKIAAGEVVERPASVVKELVENAIDAGAGQIKVFISEGGKKLIQVVDDGQGITQADLPLAFERHATSKIKTGKDLDAIGTLGFRGEALPSIASVARVEIKTRHKNDAIGSILRIEGGKKAPVKHIAYNKGTSLSVQQLFFNTPARRKFMKSDTAENQRIISTLKRFVLACPDISFELWIEGKQYFSFKKGTLKERVMDVFGHEIGDRLIEMDHSLAGVRLYGYISPPDLKRKSRSHQHLFLNGRPIQDRSLSYAIYQGYGETLKEGEHPLFCLYLTLDPSQVDVNIHPTKMQVRFSNDRSLYYMFLNSVSRLLNETGALPTISLEGSAQAAVPAHTVADEKKGADGNRGRQDPFPVTGRKRKNVNQLSLAYFGGQDTGEAGKTVPQHGDGKEHHRFWQLHGRYILSEIKSGLVIIDQHLAHARILYENTLARLNAGQPSGGQKLLFPQKITLALDDFLVFKDINSYLEKIGFLVRVFSGNTIVIEEMPADVKIGRESQILLDIIDYYKNVPHGQMHHTERIAAAFAFKNAYKPGEVLSEPQMHALVDQLFACETPFYAPNGKPAIISMDIEELKAKFR
ncbi:MAG TPA: DNA mismatch repair endonuclease MutL [Caldithrix abyssi]|uniref:DNA mismatch repair protein MutL n=1 Tax=Caldithrix abyssi TaxID=187145 RepID=A0A7V1PUR6_CALAY|nr:DNA mismatch repair endonuclease MutL [Caldithrix abyssi]